MVNLWLRSVPLILLLMLLAPALPAAEITTRVDRDPVRVNESFKIIFEADDNIGASPDFSALEQDFDILSRSRSSNMQILNGEVTQQTRWTLFVMAKRSGELTIPAIAIGQDRSPQVSVTVKPAGDDNSAAAENMDLFLEVEAQPRTAYVQQQILYTVRFFRAIDISGASMAEPSFSGAEVVMQQLGDDSRFETRRNGRRYVVIERNYALFPQQSGDITIDPIQIDAQVVERRPGVFDPFGQNTTTRRLRSQAITLDIRPIPAEVQNRPWLPAEALTLTEHWSQQDPEFVVGQPVTRTLTLKADGLTAAQLPALTMADGQGYKTYPDQARLNDRRGSQGINGTRQEKIAIIPTRAGTLTLPEIEIPWWNVNNQQMELARLPARNVRVQPGAQAATPPSPAATPQATPQSQAAGAAQTEPVVSPAPHEQRYLILSLILGAGWLLTALGWFFSRRKTKPKQAAGQGQMAQARTSLNKVKKACLGKDPQHCKAALLHWAAAHWPDEPPTSLGEIGRRLDAPTEQEIERLNRTLYGTTAEPWQGQALWQALSAALRQTPQNKDKDELLVPLYR